jgi:hypothetical protein
MKENIKECKFPNKAEALLEPPDSTGHGLSETVDIDVMRIINYESVCTVRSASCLLAGIGTIRRGAGGEVYCLDIIVIMGGMGNVRWRGEVFEKIRNL